MDQGAAWTGTEALTVAWGTANYLGSLRIAFEAFAYAPKPLGRLGI